VCALTVHGFIRLFIGILLSFFYEQDLKGVQLHRAEKARKIHWVCTRVSGRSYLIRGTEQKLAFLVLVIILQSKASGKYIKFDSS
jgi:hypothetical protein